MGYPATDMSALTTVYRSDLLTVTEYLCDHRPGRRVFDEASLGDEFVFVLDGIYRKRSGDGDAILDRSCIGVFRKNQPYRITHPVAGGDRSFIVEFASGDLSAALDAEPDARGGVTASLPSTFGATPETLAAAALLYRIVRDQPHDDGYIEELAFGLLALLVEAGTAAPPASAGRAGAARAREVAVVIAPTFRDGFSIAAVARAVGLSPFHLCHAFRAATGMTLHRYVTTLRMSEAVQRLPDYRSNLTALALELGYSSHSHFTSAFRRYYGITPTEMAVRLTRRR